MHWFLIDFIAAVIRGIRQERIRRDMVADARKQERVAESFR